jgi:BirA family biotin operon repressor/biotin-[acetyl-CoA-carboxylase] ligase
VFDLEKITAADLVAHVDFHPSIGSTSDRALELAAQGEVALPLLVLAEQQTAGRGRSSNQWLTTDGALTFSLVLEVPREQLPLSKWPQVALVAGVAVADALSRFVSPTVVRLKWPNDVYLTERKAGGILSESVSGWRNRIVVGIGVNVNNRFEATPGSDLSITATSLVEQDQVELDLTSVLLAILDEFDRRWQELLAYGFATAAASYRERCLLTGKNVRIQQSPVEIVEGVCLGIDHYGGLILRTFAGEKSFISGTVLDWS